MTTYGSIINAANKPSRRNGLAVFVAGVLALGVFAVSSRGFDNKLESGPALRSAPPPLSSEQEDCDDKELAFYTLIGNGREATFKKSGEDDQFTYYNFSVGPANLAPVVAVRLEEDDKDLYATKMTDAFFDEWEYGYMKEGIDFNPDSFFVPDAAIVTEDGRSAAITIRFAEKNGSTTLFAAQFVALDKPTEDNDLYTMVLRVYTDDEQTEASLQPTHGEGHSCFDPSAPHFHMFPHKEKLNSVLGSSKTPLVVSDAFVVEVYFPPIVLGGIAVIGGFELVGVGVACALRKINGC